MMLRHARTLAASAVIALFARGDAAAQGYLFDGEEGAYWAATTTPVGLFPSSLSPTLLRAGRSHRVTRDLSVHLQTGYMLDEGQAKADRFSGQFSRGAFAGGVDATLGTVSLGLSAGYVHFGCRGVEDASPATNCRGAATYGAGIGTPIGAAPLGDESAFVIGFDAAFGVTSGTLTETRTDVGVAAVRMRSFAAAFGLPIAFVTKDGDATVALHIDPRMIFGQAQLSARDPAGNTTGPYDSFNEGGWQPTLGGGLAVRVTGIGVDFGLAQALIKHGRPILGVGLSFDVR